MNLDRHWYRSKLTLISFLLLPLSLLFQACVFFRKKLYQYGIKKSYKVSVPVVIVGNISVGGTGKTPFVIWLTNLLRNRGYKVGIISKGYGGKLRNTIKGVSPYDDPCEVGDEVVLLAKNTDCPVVVGKNRCDAAKFLLANWDCNIIISDDGLQHYKLQRDIEIAIIDGDRLFGNHCLLPAGPLREPISRLDSVDFIISQTQEFTHENCMILKGNKLIRLTDKKEVLLNRFPDTFIHAVAGVGNPQRFFSKLRRADLNIIEHVFPDHYRYEKKDLDFGDGYPIIMTEKDAVKCVSFVNERFWYLPVEAEINDAFALRLLKKIEEKFL